MATYVAPNRVSSSPNNAQSGSKYILDTEGLNVFYGRFHAVKDINLQIERHKITALIGPSGCGKSTVLRCFNRMNDLVSSAHIAGQVRFLGKNIYDADVDAAEVRRRIGMVFQRPNPFPKNIYENIAWGARVTGYRGNMDELVEETLRSAALWNEVKDKLKQSALALSGGQQQRLCIARAIATRPDIILMDEPASALDPIAAGKIEELMLDLIQRYTIVIVTHNMQQAGRVADYTAFFTVTPDRTGYLQEYGTTQQIFTMPKSKITEDYVTGRFG
jgi:phosphate transport system ATP-binding protein